MPPIASQERLARILALVPWVLQHPAEATVDEVCRRFGVTEAQLVEDLNLLFMCGLPPFGPGDLIEAGIEGGRVVIRMADYLAHPLRLTRFEAMMLLAAGHAIAVTPGLEDAPALASALKRLEAAMAPGEAEAAARLADRVAIELEPPAPGVMDTLETAIKEQRTVRIDYYSFGRDAWTTRDVDPLLVAGSRSWYLIAEDHLSGERRTFRVDRIRSIAETGDTFERPADFDPAREAALPLYHPAPGDRTVVLELAPAAAWVAEITPHDKRVALKDGWTRLTLRTGRAAWLERLVLQLGSDVRAVDPPEIAEAARVLAVRALARYTG